MLWLILGVADAGKVRQFADEPPVWVDPDENDVGERVKDYWSGLVWDGVDQSLFRPIHRGLGLAVGKRAANVNAYDEVPNSSWFHNRIGVRAMSDEELARGACPEDSELLDPSGAWTVTAAKPNGANPGFIIRGDKGKGWLLKFDGLEQKERATTADVFGSRLYHAVGYHSPCNIVVHFTPDILSIDPEAESKDEAGNDIPMTQDDIDKVLSKAVRLPDGRYRASASLFLPGRPIGPWTYQGKRRDDPNDQIKHQDRRELRGAKLLAAWLNHFDAREQNTLDIWVEEDDGRSFIRHYYLDFGDCLGSVWWWMPLPMTARFGHSYYFDAGDVVTDWLTLGALNRPWNQVEMDDVYGYYDVEPFVPRKYKPGYPNPSFLRMDDGDGAWMARILARIDDHQLRVLFDQGKMQDEAAVEQGVAILAARRDIILADYLTVVSPLADFTVDDGALCFTDLAAQTGVISAPTYTATLYAEAGGAQALTMEGSCVAVDTPGYGIVDIRVSAGDRTLPPARLHVRGDGELRLLGIERPTRKKARDPVF